MHLNSSGTLPPVDCPLLIEVFGQILRARRVAHASNKDDDLDYIVELPYGAQEVISGRFAWTYP